MFDEKVKLIIQDKYIDLVSAVIEALRKKSVLGYGGKEINMWDAFVAQMQSDEEEEIDGIYSDTIADICDQAVRTLTPTELRLLWLGSEGGYEWEDEDDFSSQEQMFADVIEELISWVEQEAEEPEYEDDEDFDDANEGIEPTPTRH